MVTGILVPEVDRETPLYQLRGSFGKFPFWSRRAKAGAQIEKLESEKPVTDNGAELTDEFPGEPRAEEVRE
jgi:hypothetical protein